MAQQVKILVKIVLDNGALKAAEDGKTAFTPEARNVKLMMDVGATMSEMVKMALINADLYDQYRCTDVTYRDEDFDEDVYISPASRVESQSKYKMMVTRKKPKNAVVNPEDPPSPSLEYPSDLQDLLARYNEYTTRSSGDDLKPTPLLQTSNDLLTDNSYRPERSSSSNGRATFLQQEDASHTNSLRIDREEYLGAYPIDLPGRSRFSPPRRVPEDLVGPSSSLTSSRVTSLKDFVRDYDERVRFSEIDVMRELEVRRRPDNLMDMNLSRFHLPSFFPRGVHYPPGAPYPLLLNRMEQPSFFSRREKRPVVKKGKSGRRVSIENDVVKSEPS